ncbi:MAG: AraC family transcriptional regulator [Rhodobiaceae bacterium]|nr:MAG: AraC family transcriptional regulator [Rhodobiaceae bacterium]
MPQSPLKKPHQNKTRNIVILTYPGGMMLDVVGPADVFAAASQYIAATCGADLAKHDAYKVELVALEAGPLRLSNGIQMIANRSYRDVTGSVDTLILAGGSESGMHDIAQDPSFPTWLKRKANTATRLASVCTGSFLLARAGLLDGHRATTHWMSCDRLAAEHPQVSVVEDAIYVKSGSLYTSAGVSAGIDLALALVEEDFGREIAMQIARQLVLFLRRPGGQSQFSAQLAAQSVKTDKFESLLTYVTEHPETDLSVTALSSRVAMSPRNFARLFREQVGETPAKYVERARLDAARRRLEEDDDKVEAVAIATGFGTAETLRRTMKRHMAITPEAYRATFGG